MAETGTSLLCPDYNNTESKVGMLLEPIASREVMADENGHLHFPLPNGIKRRSKQGGRGELAAFHFFSDPDPLSQPAGKGGVAEADASAQA